MIENPSVGNSPGAESPVETSGCGLVCRVPLRVIALEAQSPWIMGAPSQLQVLYVGNSPHVGALATTGIVRVKFELCRTGAPQNYR